MWRAKEFQKKRRGFFLTWRREEQWNCIEVIYNPEQYDISRDIDFKPMVVDTYTTDKARWSAFSYAFFKVTFFEIYVRFSDRKAICDSKEILFRWNTIDWILL